MDVNKHIIVGNVGSEPEFHSFGDNGGEVAKFSVATSNKYKNKSGEMVETTQWHRVVTFNKGLIGIIKQHIAKGTRVYIEGEVQTRSYDKDGAKQYITELVLPNFTGRIEIQARWKGQGEGQGGGGQGGGYQGGGQSSGGSAPSSTGADDFDDDIPF